MFEKMLAKYVDQLTKNDIVNYTASKQIILTDAETDLLYEMVKKNWRVLLYGNPTPIFNDLKPKLNATTYENGIKLYEQMKQKYQSFL